MLKFLTALASYIVPVYILITLLCAWRKKTDVYPCFLVGAKEGISSAFSILPYMVGMLFAIGLWRASGIMEGIGALIDKGLSLLGVPEGLSMMLLLRPLSGSAALAELDQIYALYGPDSLQGRLASVLMGSTETILYTIPVYLGAAGIKDSGHALSASTLSMLIGIIASIWIVRLFFP